MDDYEQDEYYGWVDVADYFSPEQIRYFEEASGRFARERMMRLIRTHNHKLADEAKRRESQVQGIVSGYHDATRQLSINF